MSVAKFNGRDDLLALGVFRRHDVESEQKVDDIQVHGGEGEKVSGARAVASYSDRHVVYQVKRDAPPSEAEYYLQRIILGLLPFSSFKSLRNE